MISTAIAPAARAAVCPPRFLCLLFLFAAESAAQSGLYAQSPDVFAHPLSAETVSRYTALSAAIAARPYVTGTFEQTKTIARLNRSLTSKGNFIIAAGLGMVWDTVSPVPSTMAMGRDFIVQSSPDGSRTKIEAGGNELFVSMANTLSAIFTGDTGTLREQFDNFFMESGKGGETVWTIGLISKDRAVRSFAERIVLSGGATEDGAVIRSIVISGQNKNSVVYRLAGHRFPNGLSEHEKALFSTD